MGTLTINSRETTNNSTNEQHSPAGTWSTDRTWSMPQNGFVDRVWVYCGGFGGNTNFTFMLYRTDTGGIVGQTPAAGPFGVGYGWNSNAFALNSTNNNSGPYQAGGYNSPYIYLWAGYGMSFGAYSSSGSQAAFAGVGNHWWGSGGPNNWKVGTENQFTGGGLWAYAEYFPVATISAVSSTPVAVGQTFTITGTSFSSQINSDGIKINGAGGAVAVTSYTINSDTQITCTVPAGATTGTVTVNTNAGNPTSSGSVTISSIHYAKTGAWNYSPGVYSAKTGAWNISNGIYYAKAGAWNTAL